MSDRLTIPLRNAATTPRMDARIAELRSGDTPLVESRHDSNAQTIVVVGLGYVGLPLAVSLARSFPTWGLDIDAEPRRRAERGEDRTGEIDALALAASTLRYACRSGRDAPPADVYIVTVPTPVDERNRPDLRALLGASEMVGRMLDGSRKPLIIFESTVYPGVTEELCVPAMERVSGLTWKEGFVVGYSPERINPGDREHTVDRIVKVVSGDSPETTDRVAADLRARHHRRHLPRRLDQGGRGRQGDRERAARRQHRLHERGDAHLLTSST